MTSHPGPAPVPRYRTGPDGGLDIDTVYTRCPQCSIVATSTGVSYVLTADGGFDDTQPIELSCIAAGHRYAVTAADFLPHDACGSCVRCATVFAVPATADQVVCPSCRLYQDAPFLHLDDQRRGQLDGTRQQYLDKIRTVLGHPPHPDPATERGDEPHAEPIHRRPPGDRP